MKRHQIRKFLSSSCLFGPLALLLGAGAPAEDGKDWPQWRGPELDGISRETGWRVEGKAEPLWKKNVGLGYSTVSVVGDRLYTMGHSEEYEEDCVYCLDVNTGEEIWVHPFPAKVWKKFHGGGTLSTPSVDGDSVFVFNREGHFFCLDAATGEVRWEKQLKEEHGLEYPTWMFAAAPLVLDDMIVVNGGVVLAFDRKGKLLWKSKKDSGHAYSTPAVCESGGRACLAVFNGDGLIVLDRKNGKRIASYEWKTKYDVNAATPVVIDDRVFISSGYNQGGAMLELKGSKLKLLWESKVMRTQMSGCMLWEDHLYGVDENILKCIDLDGEEKWAQKDFGKGAIVLADGKIVGMSGKGELVIAEASSKGYTELLRRKILSGGVYWTTPVVVGGMIYCKNSRGDLVCLDHRPQSK